MIQIMNFRDVKDDKQTFFQVRIGKSITKSDAKGRDSLIKNTNYRVTAHVNYSLHMYHHAQTVV